MDAAVFQLPWSSALGGLALLVRASTYVAVAPLVGAEMVPPQVRIAFALLLVLLLAPVVPAADISAGPILLVATEAFVGLLLGSIARLFGEVFSFAGAFVGYPSGLASAQLMDPVNQVQSTSLGMLYTILGMLFLFALGGHRELIAAFAKSYEIVPVGTAHLDGPWLPAFVALTGRVIVIGFRLAAPLFVAGLLADLCLMLVARAAPQLNILVIGAPVRVVVSLVALAFSLHVFAPIAAETLAAVIDVSGRALAALRG